MRKVATLLFFCLVLPTTASASVPERSAPAQADITALETVLRLEQRLARDFGTCFIKCEDRFSACMAAASDAAAARACKLQRSECASFCSKFTR